MTESRSTSKMVRCPVHHTYYPEADGCIKCAEGEAGVESSAPAGGERNFPVIPLAALVLVAGIAAVVISNRSPRSESAENAPAVSAVSLFTGKLNPEPYRSEIERLEAVLYGADGSDFNALDNLEAAARDLSDAIDERGGALAGRASLEILTFGSTVGSLMDIGFGSFNPRQLLGEWEEVRSGVFARADWFRSSEGLAEGPPGGIGPDQVAAVRAWYRGMSQLVRTERSTANRVGEVVLRGNGPTTQDQRALNDWNRWRNNFVRRLNRLTSQAPPMPRMGVGVPTAYSNAHLYLSQAQRALQDLVNYPGATGVPPRATRSSIFDAAGSYLDDTREALSQLAR